MNPYCEICGKEFSPGDQAYMVRRVEFGTDLEITVVISQMLVCLTHYISPMQADKNK